MTNFLLSLQQRYSGRQMSSWLRPSLVLLILAASYLLGRRATLDSIFMLIGLIGALIFIRMPILAVIPLVISAFLVRYEIGTGTQTTLNPVILLIATLIGLWVMHMLVLQRRIYLYPSRVIAPIFAFSIIALLSFIAGQLPWFSFATQVSLAAQIGGLMLFLLSTGAFLWISQYMNDVKWLQWMVWLFLSIGGFYILGNLLVGDRIGRLIVSDSTGSVTWLWLVALSSSQAIFNKQLKQRERVLLGLLTFFTLLAGWRNRQWASGWIPASIALVVVIFFINWRLGIFTGLFVGIAFIYLNPESAQEFFTRDQYSLYTRQEAWKILLGQIARVSPILGLGPSNYYNYTPLFSILGYYVRFNSHNQYVDLIAQVGFLGLIAYLWIFGEVAWLGWKLKDKAAEGFEKAFVIGALGGVAGTLASGMFGDWVIPFVYNIGITGYRSSVFTWLFMGGLLVIERMVNERSKAAQVAGN